MAIAHSQENNAIRFGRRISTKSYHGTAQLVQQEPGTLVAAEARKGESPCGADDLPDRNILPTGNSGKAANDLTAHGYRA